MENPTGSPPREGKDRGMLASCAYYIVACAVVLLAAKSVVLPALGMATDMPLTVLLVLAVIGLPVVALTARRGGGSGTPAETRSTSFVERRVLRNMAPINDKRHGGFSDQEKPDNFLWVITAETGPLDGLSYGVVGGIVVGRSLESDLALVNPQISRRHARFYEEGEQLFIEDLGSTIGTVVNGKLIDSRQLLEVQDEVRFHDIVFRISHGGAFAGKGQDPGDE